MSKQSILRATRRTIHSLLLLLGVSLFSFVLLTTAPGSFFDELRLNPQISPQTIAAFQAQYGMGWPLPVRYGLWLAALAKGEMGYSLQYRRPVGSLLWPRAKNTLLLAGTATVLAWAVALIWGILLAIRGGTW